MAGINSSKKKERDQRIDRAATWDNPFMGMLRSFRFARSVSHQASARTSDGPASCTRQQLGAQTRETIDMTGDTETSQSRKENDTDAVPVGATSAQGQKRKLPESNSKASAQITKEYIDLTGAQESSTRITEDEWREKVGLPKIKRVRVDLTEASGEESGKESEKRRQS